MLLASRDRNLGYCGCSLQIDQKRSSSSQPLKGDWPINISYRRTPKDHQSTHWLYFSPFIICFRKTTVLYIMQYTMVHNKCTYNKSFIILTFQYHRYSWTRIRCYTFNQLCNGETNLARRRAKTQVIKHVMSNFTEMIVPQRFYSMYCWFPTESYEYLSGFSTYWIWLIRLTLTIQWLTNKHSCLRCLIWMITVHLF